MIFLETTIIKKEPEPTLSPKSHGLPKRRFFDSLKKTKKENWVFVKTSSPQEQVYST